MNKILKKIYLSAMCFSSCSERYFSFLPTPYLPCFRYLTSSDTEQWGTLNIFPASRKLDALPLQRGRLFIGKRPRALTYLRSAANARSHLIFLSILSFLLFSLSVVGFSTFSSSNSLTLCSRALYTLEKSLSLLVSSLSGNR